MLVYLQRPKQMFVRLLLTEHKQFKAHTWKGYHIALTSQHCNAMLINFTQFRILIFQSTPMRVIHTQISVLKLHYFDLREFLRMAPLCQNMSFVISCILLCALVDCCINYMYTHCLNNIQKIRNKMCTQVQLFMSPPM